MASREHHGPLRALLLAGLCVALALVEHGAAASPPTDDPPADHVDAPAPSEPQRSAHIGSHGGTLIADAHGLLVVERSVGEVIRTDHDGKPRARLTLTPGLGELVHDGAGLMFVADRGAHRVVRIAADGLELAELTSIPVREPHGLALTPDGALLLVTSVADHELLAFDTQTSQLRWRLRLAPEPRPVAVSGDGKLAAVGFLSSGALAIIDLQGREPTVQWLSLDPRDHVDIDIEEWENSKYGSWREVDVREVESRSRFRVPVETGRQYVRNVRALAFDGEQLVAVHQLATPQLERMPDRSLRDAYGGGDREVEPIAHRMSIITRPGHLDARVESKPVAAHQPMALLYMPAYRDWLVAGQGNVWVEARFGSDFLLPHGNDDDPRLRCGADGLALALDGNTLWLHCGLTRRLASIAVPSANRVFTMLDDPLAPSRVDAQLELGAALFNARDWRFSSSGMACASCHPEGRTDGLSWRLGPEILQTPILAGRVGDTAPYKWDGQDATLPASFRHTIQRLAGESRDVTAAEYNALAAYLDSLPAPLPRSVAAPEAAARGRALFEAQSCDACHSDPKLTDGAQHRLATRLRQVDTPSLIGLGHSRPYYHDGSAQDLWTLLTDKASVHDMADFSGLDDAQLRDLIAYLEGL